MILADIGNSRVHIYNGKDVIHLSYQEFFENYSNKKLYYISVKHQLKSRLKSVVNWIDISDKIELKNSYDTMGVDRKALCLSHRDGIFISAGSAITVDIVRDSIYQGGFILLGFGAYIKAYESISPALKVELNLDVDLNILHRNTQDSISYGIISSIKNSIAPHQDSKKIYITGGDGKFLSRFFQNSIFDEKLIFYGMRKVIEE